MLIIYHENAKHTYVINRNIFGSKFPLSVSLGNLFSVNSCNMKVAVTSKTFYKIFMEIEKFYQCHLK